MAPNMKKAFLFSPLIVLCVMVGVLIMGKLKAREKGPDQLGELPKFELIDQDGNIFDSTHVKSSARVVNFMFTQCNGICPSLSAEMVKIQKLFRSPNALELISVSIDPKNDTPENLRAFIKERKVNTKNWSYLTGEKENIAKIMSQYFKIAFHDNIQTHTERFVLIDKNNQIRGYYSMASDNKAFARLKKDISWLLHH
jgi:protein SCO1